MSNISLPNGYRAAASVAGAPTVGKRVAGYALALLTLISFFNYMDRMVLAVLLEPIRKELHLGDGQLGLLTGFAFAALYATLGIPLARLADRASRVKLLAVCLGLWSLMTAATGGARSFTQLFFARMGVGIGEAGCLPAAHSLIGDYFPPERRALGVSTFQAGALAGVSAGLLIAGILADHLGWRGALFVVGLSGLPLAVIVPTTLGEPLRRGHDRALALESAWSAIAALLRRRALAQLIIAISIGGFGNYGINQWLPSFYVRSFGLSLTKVGLWAGMAAGVGGVLGVICGGLAAVRLSARDARWELWLPAIAYASAAPVYALAFLSRTPELAIGIVMLATFLVASGAGVAMSAIQTFAEPNRRATAIALTLFLSSVLGLGLGPLLVGLLSDVLKPAFGQDSLRYALLASTSVLVWAGAHFYFASRAANRDSVSAEVLTGAAPIG
jgi:predicted MFS family arabinose efflux permease